MVKAALSKRVTKANNTSIESKKRSQSLFVGFI
jgi:hypothetical protein